MKESAFVSAVVYAQNNEGVIQGVLHTLDRFLDDTFENFEIIVVNDASADRTADEIKSLSGSLTRDLKVIGLAWKHGPDNGILAGVDLAIGDFIIEAEAGEFDCGPGTLLKLFEEANKGLDIVSAVRRTGRRPVEEFFFRLFNSLSYLPFEVNGEAVRVVSRRAVNAVTGMNERMVYRGIQYRFSGFPGRTIEYVPASGRAVKGHKRLGEKIRLALDVAVSYSNIGMNISAIFSSLFMALSLALSIYALLAYFILRGVVPGWTTTVIFMSLCFSGVFFVLGLQGKYISSIVSDIKKRPAYVVRSMDKVAGRDVRGEGAELAMLPASGIPAGSVERKH